MSEELEPAAPSDGEKESGWIARLGVVGSVRVVIGGFGLAAFVVGTIIAWRSGSATTLLVVSAVLLVLAALGLDWNKIRGTYGGWTVELLRSFETRIEQVAATAATEEASPAIREELETLRTEVKALTPQARPRRTTAAPTIGPNIDALVKDLLTTRATHTFRGSEAVQLSVRIASTAERFSCTVKTPTGSAFTAYTRRPINPGASIVGVTSYSVIYPDEFLAAEPFTPGLFEVEWRPAPLVDPANTNLLAAAFAGTLGRAVATDSFSIPEKPTAPPETPPAAAG